MATLQDLIRQKEALEAQIEAVRKTEVSEAVSRAKALIAEYDLTVQDIFDGSKRGPKAGKRSAVAPKFRDPATGATWSGRGIAPKWLQGKDKEAFRIKD